MEHNLVSKALTVLGCIVSDNIKFCKSSLRCRTKVIEITFAVSEFPRGCRTIGTRSLKIEQGCPRTRIGSTQSNSCRVSRFDKYLIDFLGASFVNLFRRDRNHDDWCKSFFVEIFFFMCFIGIRCRHEGRGKRRYASQGPCPYTAWY